MRLLTIFAVASLLAPFALSAPQTGGGVTVGGTGGGAQQGGGGGSIDDELVDTSTSKSKKVKPGESHTNGDGVTVTNNSDKYTETIKMTPAAGDEDSATDVQTKGGVEGDISGIDENDTVGLSSNNTVTVSGTGGTVTIASSSVVTVTNTSPIGSGQNINVVTLSGTTVYILPGKSQTFNT